MVAFDVSVARSRLPEFSDRVRALLRDRFRAVRLCDYGHWGDGGSHLNLLWRERDVEDAAALKRSLQDEVYALAVGEFGGSFSAEHGVGVMKPHVLHLSKRPPVIGVMHALKRLLDPHGILNPGKVLPPPPEDERPWRSAS